jgi:Uma2 family endonuclease
MAPAGGAHGRIAARLLGRMFGFVETHRLGELFAAETGFRLRRDPDTVRAPDVAFVGADRAAEAGVPGFPAVVPDQVAEVVGPSDRAVDVVGEALAWLDAGCGSSGWWTRRTAR